MGALSAALSERNNDASLHPLERRQDELSDTRNELAECKPVTVIFARGTLELGNVGSITGPPFFEALAATIGGDNFAVQGVDYPATIEGYLEGGDPGGAATAAALLEQAATQCPGTQIVLSGYSQGSQVVHLGEAMVSAAVAASIAAVVVFGDPFKGRPFPNIPASNVKTFCFALDLICEDTIVVDTYHLSYSIDAIPAAQFVQEHVNL
ncbi:cutinase, partial [Lecanoromycetidae sp. Uapishka_2]